MIYAWEVIFVCMVFAAFFYGLDELKITVPLKY